MMTNRKIIEGALIVDGTGAPARQGDILVEGDTILAAAGRHGHLDAEVVDGRGLVACPGFIELHTHYDPQLCWDRKASPAAEHGVTTVITGHCSISLAPVTSETAPRVTRLFNRIEDIRPEFFAEAVPFSWNTFEEYLEFLRPGLGVNVASSIGHSTLRHCVMGEAAQARAATRDEITAMCRVVKEAARAGAFGLSMSFDHVHDDRDRPVASSCAAFEERVALARALSEAGRRYVQCTIHPLDSALRRKQYEELARMSIETGVTVSVLGVMENPVEPGQWQDELKLLELLHERGARIYAESQVRPMDISFQLCKAWIVAFYMPTWADIMLRPPADRIALFGTAELRPRLDREAERFSALMRSIRVRTASSAANQRYVGKSLAELAASESRTMTDVMLDIAVADGLETVFDWKNAVHADDEIVSCLLKHPMIRVGGSDAGAHLTQFAGEGDTTYMLEHFVRRTGRLRLEEAVRRMTSDIAETYGLERRGRLARGCLADIVLFDAASVRRGDEVFVDDVPGGGGRYVRHASGVDKVFVNGSLFVQRGEYTAARSGRVV